jgi:FlaA1/EpsC-like NDP-sugar epimerase
MHQIKKFFLLRSEFFIPGWIILTKDLVLILVSFAAAYTLRYNFQLPDIILRGMYTEMIPLGLVTLIVYYAFGLSKSIIRHTGITDVLKIIKANFFITAFLLTLNIAESYIVFPFIFRIPHSVIIIFFMIANVLVILTRFAVRIFYFWLKSGVNVKRILIYGAGSAGIITKNVLQSDQSSLIKVVGFIDNNQGKIGKTIEGTYVYSNYVLNEKFLRDNGISEIIFAINNIGKERRRELVEEVLKQTNLRVKEIPPVGSWVNGQLSLKQISTVKIAELLQRSEIKLKNEHVSRQIRGKRIMVTGAAGSIGSELVRQLIRFRPSILVLVDQGETPMFHLESEIRQWHEKNQGDVTDAVMMGTEFLIANVGDYEVMKSVFDQYRPEIIYHAAAYKHVPMMERNPFEAVRVNVLGTKNLADLAALYHAEKFVMISTDKAVNPTNVMGATKRAAEIYIQSLNNKLHREKGSGLLPITEFITTRFGNVLGSNGSVIPVFEKQIAAGGPVTVTHPDITRYFMTIPEACQLVLEAGAYGKGGEILMFDMGKPVKIADLAYNMIRLSGLEPGKDIKIVYTGLRPGEKLYEELLYDKEHSQTTHHPKIFIANTISHSYEYVSAYIDSLSAAGRDREDSMKLIAKLKGFIPEFKSKNSVFEVLDKIA